MTLFPTPVEPAISRCGMDSSAATLMRPLMSLPNEIVRRDAESSGSVQPIYHPPGYQSLVVN